MTEELINELEIAIETLKKEIVLKQDKLNDLIAEHQKLNGIIPNELADINEE